MTDTNMPTTEAGVAASERELTSYELAYHVLPTVAEGEVAAVTSALTAFITQAGGEIFDEEAAEHFELAYEIEKYLEGKYRRFGSAYFGWVRFRLEAGALATVVESVEAHKSILRSLTIRLTKAEEENPFRFHPSLAETRVRTIDTDEVVAVEEEVVDVPEEVDAVVADEIAAEVVK
jgi:ribosomal protein S6